MINPLIFLYIGLGAATLYAIVFLLGTWISRRNAGIISRDSDQSGKWNYDQSAIRRRDRLLDESIAVDLLRTAEYGILSMTDVFGKAYGVPVNFAYDGDGHIYIHYAPDGRKLRAISSHPDVSFCIIGNTHVLPRKFTTNYESVICECVACAELDELERRRALELIIEKYASAFKETGLNYIDKSFHRTAVIRLDIISASGKSKSVTE